MEEYRLLNGWSKDKKKGSERFDRIPVKFVEEICIDRKEDYMQLIPFELPEPFTVKEFAKQVKADTGVVGVFLLMMTELGIVNRVGKRGNSILYEVNEA